MYVRVHKEILDIECMKISDFKINHNGHYYYYKKCINLHIFHRLEKHMTWLVTCMHTWQIILILQGVPRGYGTPYKTWTKSIDFTLTTNVWREAFDMIFDVKTTWWYSTCWMTLWQDVILMTFDNDIIWLWRWQQNVTKFVFLCDFANYMFVKIVRLFNLCYELSLKLIKFWKLAFFQNQLFIQNLIIDSIHKSCSTI